MAGKLESDARVFFRDVKPYDVVDDLDSLRGPRTGVIQVAHHVLWSPGGGLLDLDDLGERRVAYQAVLAEGDVDDQIAVLNREVLIAIWSDLMLPARVRSLWEGRFPELLARELR
jgi:hypothetical protein